MQYVFPVTDKIECPETDWRSALFKSLKIRSSYWSKFKFRLTFYLLKWREKYTFKQGTFHAIWTPWLSLFFLCYGRARSDDNKICPIKCHMYTEPALGFQICAGGMAKAPPYLLWSVSHSGLYCKLWNWCHSVNGNLYSDSVILVTKFV